MNVPRFLSVAVNAVSRNHFAQKHCARAEKLGVACFLRFFSEMSVQFVLNSGFELIFTYWDHMHFLSLKDGTDDVVGVAYFLSDSYIFIYSLAERLQDKSSVISLCISSCHLSLSCQVVKASYIAWFISSEE